MKLPTDKKQRLQMLALMGIVAIGAIYALIHFAIMPFLQSREDIPQQLEELERNVSVAERSISFIPENLKKYNAAVADIHDINEQYFLKPVLGTRILVAQQIIEDFAQAFGVEIESYREDGLQHLPKPSRAAPDYRVQPYAVTVTLKTDYDTLTRLIAAMEQSNPYLSILDLSIREQRASPTAHEIRFKVQWPAWVDDADLPRFIDEEELL